MKDQVIFSISQALQGGISIHDILSSTGTIAFQIDKKSELKNDFIFTLQTEGFIFNYSIQNQSLVLQRNNIVSVLLLKDIPDNKRLSIFAQWKINELILICIFGPTKEYEKKVVVETPPLAPPNKLIIWAKKNNLLPIDEYDSEEQFRTKVHSCLLSVQHKIHEIGAYAQFWNIEYSGNKIVNRTPKHETEVQPTICMLKFLS